MRTQVIYFDNKNKKHKVGSFKKYSAARWVAYNLSKKRGVDSAHAVNGKKECRFVKGKSLTFNK